MSDETLQCSFCGKNREDVEKLIAGPSVYICNECVNLSYHIVQDAKNPEGVEIDLTNIPGPAEIKAHFDEYIVGHDQAKEMLAVSAYNHYKRVLCNTAHDDDIEIEKSNILLIGPTGNGKTLFAKTLAKKMQVPFAIADATTLTEAGYVGEDVDSVIERLLSNAGFDVERAQKGIIYIDEIDKKARKGESNANARDVSGEGVQQALLRLIEGTTTKVKLSTGKKYEEYVDFDTSDILFIVGGSFVGLDKIIERRLKKSSTIGFNAVVMTEVERTNLLQYVTEPDIIAFGIIPELMGRLPIIGTLDKLNKTQLVNVMTTVKNNIIQQNQKLLALDDITLEFGEHYYEQAAEIAAEKNLGARALKGIIDQSLINIMYRAPELRAQGVKSVIFKSYPIKGYKPILVFADHEVSDDQYKLYRDQIQL